jgi:hypothetical protein
LWSITNWRIKMSKFKALLALLLIISLGAGGLVYAQSFTRTWNAAYEASPADTDSASEGAQRIRNLKTDIRERMEDEHDWGDINQSDTNVHVEGAARIFVQSAAPATTPGGAAIDDGRMWLDTDDDKLYVYDAGDAAWEEIVDAGDHVTLSTAQNITGTKTFDKGIFKRLNLTVQEVSASTYTTGTDYNVYLADCNSNAITLSIADATHENGELLIFKLIDATNALTLDTAGSDTIDGDASQTLSTLDDYYMFVYDSSNTDWRIVGGRIEDSVTETELSDEVVDMLRDNTFFGQFGGDGSDGAVNLDGTTLTISDTGSDGIEIKQYSSITMVNNATITAASTIKTLIIGVSGTTSIPSGSNIHMNFLGGSGTTGDGNPGGFGRSYSTGTTVADSTAVVSPLNLAGGGGAGGAGTSSLNGDDGGAAGNYGGAGDADGGAVGVAVPDAKTGYNSGRTTFLFNTFVDTDDDASIDKTSYATRFLRDCMFSYGAGGGGSGINTGTPVQASGGDGGGSLYGEFNGALTLGGSISANGGPGDDGSVGNASGGGAGGGGFVAVLYRTKSGAGVVTAGGGIGGSGAGTGYNGGNGAAGFALALDVDG